jgi:hypothetical protein
MKKASVDFAMNIDGTTSTSLHLMALELSRDQVNRLANLGLTAEAHSKNIFLLSCSQSKGTLTTKSNHH